MQAPAESCDAHLAGAFLVSGPAALIHSDEQLERLMDENGKGGAGQEKTPPFANIKSA
jgi:hypothetical protein